MSALYTGKNINFSYFTQAQLEVPVIKNASFQIASGGFSCLMGPSGTGKTTLLNLLGLIENPSEGSLKFLDHNVFDLTEKQKENIRLKSVGFIFQNFYLLPTLTVFENASYFLPLLGLSKKDSQIRVNEYLKKLGIYELKDRMPYELSGGQRQRVAIARAIVKKPRVILADEPTANIDTDTATAIVSAFQDLQKTEGVSFLFSTHDQRLVNYCDTIYRIERGQVIEDKK